MIWHYFPIGFRFPVNDFSDRTKASCWNTAISALLASGGTDATLYEAQENFDYGSDGPVYTCIACFYGVKQSRAVAKKLYELDRLMTELCLHLPFVQANYLESFGPYPILGKLETNGVSEITEAGAAFLPISAQPMSVSDGQRILIAAEPLAHAITAERISSVIGRIAASQNFRIKRKSLANHGAGAVRALVSSLNGRYESIAIHTDEERIIETIGILPGEKAVVERDDHCSDVLLRAADLGYHRFCITEPESENRTELPHEDPRLSQCSISYLSGKHAEEAILEEIGFDTAAKQSDMVMLFVNTFTEETEIMLTHLQEQRKPAILIAADMEIDTSLLLRSFPVLRDVRICRADRDSYQDAISNAAQAAVAKVTTKDVVNATLV